MGKVRQKPRDRHQEILEAAAQVITDRGLAETRIQDIADRCGVSPGLILYYFESKEKLLYLIQKDLFTTVMELLRERLKEVAEPEARVRMFILNHVEYFLAKPKAMKVLSHEDDVLRQELSTEIVALKRQYYHCCADLVEALKAERNLTFNSRAVVMSLFGMINWLHTWYNPRVDGTPRFLAGEIGDIFLRGVYSCDKVPERLVYSS